MDHLQPASADDALIASLAERFLRALLEGEAVTAAAVLDEGLERGLHAVTLYQHVITPALVEIGRRWTEGELGIAEEHLATQITLQQMDRLRREVRPRIARNIRAVVATVAGNAHTLGARMVADVLTFDGWHVDYLGSAVPAPDLSAFAERRRADLIALSATMPGNLSASEEAIQALRRLEPPPAILFGGAAAEAHADELRAQGADAIATDVLDALHQARRLVGLEPRTPSLEQYLHQLGQRVKSLRQSQGWSQQQLAEASGLDRTYISAVEHGKQNLTIEALLKLAEALEVSLPELFSENGLDRLTALRASQPD